jgi:capsular exopolysaccharide synthesis family protein
MGRVYNALVRADRLPGRDPIGRPESEDAGTQGHDQATSDTATRRHGDTATHNPATKRTAQPSRVGLPAFDFDATTQAASDASHANDSAFNNAFDHEDQYCNAFDQEDQYPRAAFEFETDPPLSESFIGRATPPLMTPQPPKPVAASPRPRVSASSSANPVAASPRPCVAVSPQFVEPREVVNVKSLTLDAQLAALTASDALVCERYRTLAVRTTALAARRKAKTLLVTSADDGEGKSTIAANLAWTMAQRTERRVLLMDVNLRASSVGRLLKVAPARGWLEMIDAATELMDAAVRIDPNGLYVMLSQGAHQDAPLDGLMLNGALASARFEKLMAALTERFDFVILDGPALLGSADAQQLAAITDGTILVTRAARTPHHRVTDALELVPQDRRFGVVLNESESPETTAPRSGGRRSRVGRLFGRA